MSESMAAKVRNYLKSTNRPFSANDVFNNLNTNDNKLSKTAVTKAIEELAANQEIKEKVNGKQKIYFADQNNFETFDDNQTKQIEEEYNQLTQQLDHIHNECRLKESKLKSVSKSLTLEEIRQNSEQLELEINEMEERVESSGTPLDFDPQIFDRVKTLREKWVKEWSRRKRMANQMIDTILESYPKSKSDLIEETGIETDEEMGVVMPRI